MLKFRNLNLFITIFLVSCFLFLVSPASAAGLVPCGGPSPEHACTTCDFFVLLQNIINFMVYVSTALATLMAAYIGFLFLFSGGSPAKITDAKKKLWLLVLGIAIVFGSWLIINTILNLVVDPAHFHMPWNQISC